MKCVTCSHISSGGTPPEVCPVCGTSSEKSKEMVEKRWKCTVCGYIHTGQKPQEVCPVCKVLSEKFVELDKDDMEISSLIVEKRGTVSSGEEVSRSILNTFAYLLVRHHFNPIFSHFPNGILPVVVTLLCISIGFNLASLESAASSSV